MAEAGVALALGAANKGTMAAQYVGDNFATGAGKLHPELENATRLVGKGVMGVTMGVTNVAAMGAGAVAKAAGAGAGVALSGLGLAPAHKRGHKVHADTSFENGGSIVQSDLCSSSRENDSCVSKSEEREAVVPEEEGEKEKEDEKEDEEKGEKEKEKEKKKEEVV